MEMVSWRGRALSAEVTIRNFIFPQDYPAVYLLWQNAGAGIHLRRSDTPEEIAKKLERDPDTLMKFKKDLTLSIRILYPQDCQLKYLLQNLKEDIR